MARARFWLVALAVVAATTPLARAAALPEWAEGIAKAAVMPEGTIGDSTWRVLLDETVYEVSPAGALSMKRRIARQALDDRVEGTIGGVGFLAGEKVLKTRAWHVPGDGGRIDRSSKGDSVDVRMDDSFLGDQRMRMIAIAGLKRGSLVFFEFESETTLEVLSVTWSVSQAAPLARARLALEVPAGWTVRHAWSVPVEPATALTATPTTWEIRDLPKLTTHELGPEFDELQPMLVLTLHPPPGTSVGPVAVESWSDLGRWYAGLVKDRLTRTPEVEAFAAQVRGDATQPIPERVRNVSAAVRDRVRYVAQALGAGRYQPRPAHETLATLWGDCKDKSTLLASALSTEGVVAYPVLVSATSRVEPPASVPTAGLFDHLILAIRLPGEAAVPASLAPAVAEVEGLGRLLFVDPTDEYSAVGHLSTHVAGKTALLVEENGGRLVRIPQPPASSNRVDFVVRGRLLPTGGVEVTLEAHHRGEPASRNRASYRADSEEYRKATESWISSDWVGATIGPLEVVDTEDGLVERISWKADRLPGGGKSLPIFVRTANWIPAASVTRRAVPVVYGYPRTIHASSTWEGLPTGATPDAPLERELAGVRVKSSTTLDGDKATASLEIEWSRTEFGVEEFRDLRRLYSTVGAAFGATVHLP